MNIEIWITFVLTVLVFALIPGPTVILVISQAINHGKKSVIPLVTGVILGDIVAMILSFIGLGVILATSATLFFIVKWLGVAYLFYLGIKTWNEKISSIKKNKKVLPLSKVKMFSSSFLVTVLNPKGIMFFVAFLPQFISTSTEVLPQLLILTTTFTCITAMTITSYAMFASLASQKIHNFKVRKMLNKIGASSLILAALFTATMKRA